MALSHEAVRREGERRIECSDAMRLLQRWDEEAEASVDDEFARGYRFTVSSARPVIADLLPDYPRMDLRQAYIRATGRPFAKPVSEWRQAATQVRADREKAALAELRAQELRRRDEKLREACDERCLREMQPVYDRQAQEFQELRSRLLAGDPLPHGTVRIFEVGCRCPACQEASDQVGLRPIR